MCGCQKMQEYTGIISGTQQNCALMGTATPGQSRKRKGGPASKSEIEQKAY